MTGHAFAAALPWAALASGAAAAAALCAHAAGRTGWDRWARRMTWLTACLAAASFLRLLWAFVVVDLRLESVHLYTSTSTALRWRIAGAWTGREGSVLLWTAWAALVAAAYAWRSRLRPGPARDATAATASLLLLPLLWMSARQGAFDATPQFLLDGLPQGNGINPTLRSPFILIHPPLMFLAYALTAVPAAAALGHLATGHGQWSRAAATWARLDWLVYTVAIGLGSMWAFVTLNFGGYWAWDPVEVANLLPWLALTVYLHAQVRNLRGGDFASTGPMLALLPWLLTLFSTLSTRSGLWVSVHAFTDPTQTYRADPLARFQDILAAEPSLAPFVGLSIAASAVALGLWGVRLAREQARLGTYARWLAVGYGGVAGWAWAAPASLLGAATELASIVSAGRPGLGLLGLLFLAVAAPAIPALAAPEAPARAPDHTGGSRFARWAARISPAMLARAATVGLALGLLVMVLWHMAATRGWSTALYERRFPLLGIPLALGLAVMGGQRVVGARGSLMLAGAGGALAAAAAFAWPAAAAGAMLAVLSVVALLVCFEALRRACVPSTAGRRRGIGAGLLLAGALLDLVFWIDPPSTIGWGALAWHPVWPQPLVPIALSMYALWGTLRSVAGAPPRWPWHIPVLVGALGGFGIAPLLAAAGWLLARRGWPPATVGATARRTLRRAGVYGMHLAIAMTLVGYSATTVLRDRASETLVVGEGMDLGPLHLSLEAAVPRGEGTFASGVDAAVRVTRSGHDRGTAHPSLQWEPATGAHFPLPGHLRLWDRVVDVSVERVMLDADGPCGGRAVTAYEGSLPVCVEDRVVAATVTATSLPGLTLVWASVALLGAFMALLLFVRRDAD